MRPTEPSNQPSDQRPVESSGGRRHEVADVVTVGETMAAFVGHVGSRDYVAVPAGAESNVAAAVAVLGHRSRWVSRLGDDHLGRFVAEEVAASGVELDVDWDDLHPTGAMTKHIGDDRTSRVYYRSRSAARRLSPDDAHRVGTTRWLHLTGITPAISPTAAELVEALVAAPPAGARVSFDVNLRPELWPDLDRAREVIVGIARRADLVLIGDDEARALLGTDDAGELADALIRREGQELVVKRGAGAATSLVGSGETTVPALRAPVVDVTGAGDAFAAGCLTGHLRDWPAESRLRLGHVLASRVIGTPRDVLSPVSPDELAAFTPERLASQWHAAD